MDWTIWPSVPPIWKWPYRVESGIVVEVEMTCDPMASPRPKVTRNGTFMGKDYTEHRDLLSWRMKKAMGGRGPVDHAVGIRVWFQKASRHRRDVDNYLKTVLDAGNGVLWEDDVQVVEAFGRCFYQPAEPLTRILVYRTVA